MLLVSVGLLVAAFALYTLVPALLIHAEHPLPVYALLLGSVGAAVASRRRGALRWITIGAAALVTLLFVAHTTFVSRLDRGELAVRAGEPFPEFTLETSAKQSFSPSELQGRSAALYVFYRGHW
ncbi:MAG: hypothetical protein ACREQ9_23465 [Candidatus Binatia bacterium]